MLQPKGIAMVLISGAGIGHGELLNVLFKVVLLYLLKHMTQTSAESIHHLRDSSLVPKIQLILLSLHFILELQKLRFITQGYANFWRAHVSWPPHWFLASASYGFLFNSPDYPTLVSFHTNTDMELSFLGFYRNTH